MHKIGTIGSWIVAQQGKTLYLFSPANWSSPVSRTPGYAEWEARTLRELQDWVGTNKPR